MAINSDYVQQMSTQLATYEVQSSLDRLNRNESRYKAQREALNSLRTSMTTFKSAITKLNSSTSSMLTNSATFSQEGYATASVGTTATAGTYDFFVERLASKQQVAVQGLVDGSLSGTLTLNAQSFDLSQYATLGDAATAINDAGLGVQATLVRSNGAVSLVVSSEQTGAANAFSLSMAGNAAATTTALSTAQDAMVRMGGSYGAGGIELTSASNTFTDVIDGVSLTVSKTHAATDTPLTVTVGQDKAGTQAKAQTFIDAFNALMTSFDSLTASGSGSDSAKRGALAGDSSVRSIESRLNSLLRADFGGKSLIEFGISADRNGKLTIDAKRFEAAVANDPAGFEELFTGTDKLLESMDKTVASYTSSTNGLLKSRMDTLDMSLRRIDEQFETLQQQYDTHYSRYLRQFTSMMQTMQSMEQTSGMFSMPTTSQANGLFS
ncbi:MAG: flagellar filament capping protein FliD [Gammaproteobacteria bacterium]|uniref:flagellar filament capping protein FliD n=1 Tax=Stutzerimonas xanthomarina TaxID=271420 RepID=UPI00190C0861|nr:flagellar filament capping protein FliD [Stutzerimonas xanthomarina]MBU0813307.1 flagellar filament capping protein FliD [Gammaproteobacteria bacterium]MBK3849791.1 flagellar filament capping protein FliD [Stutzerimonas xanthomarina]MBU0853270.1 flagellar filament capping protein FliD [Gammaproteobacteria bacterium]MBU1300611.1 flagellar filament capping protein FliD [Gammaproteobacteria bacterium]MBU1460985.1 flagellar filament capping protein FliD [Gammaproteobacteria bacterium]